MTRVRQDEAIFELLRMAGIEPFSTSKERLEFMLAAAEHFVNSNSWLFLDSAYGNWSINYLKTAVYHSGPSMFSMLVAVRDYEKKGATQEEVEKKISEYMQAFGYAQIQHPALTKNYTWHEDSLAIIYQNPTYVRNYYSERTFNYIFKRRVKLMEQWGQQFKEYINLCLKAYDDQVKAQSSNATNPKSKSSKTAKTAKPIQSITPKTPRNTSSPSKNSTSGQVKIRFENGQKYIE